MRASSAACNSASLRRFSTSSLLKPLELVIVIFCSLPVDLSLALTFNMPLASISNVTSICGRPRGAGAMPSKRKFPISLLSRAIGRSPCNTRMSTAVWLSEYVENICEAFLGIVVLRSIIGVETPPAVSMESVSGVTSKSKTSLTSPCNTPP
ncbi:uncharacterized protein BN601_01294 [Coraliomargarita sp. CAG:312]|nr:uncharacterized protein BN601_01294 [Coraliomargarita sp. CAG:312]